jgi:hypothetical protein
VQIEGTSLTPGPDPEAATNKPFHQFRQGLTNMADDMHKFADSHASQLTPAARALLHVSATSLEQVPVGKSAGETGAMAILNFDDIPGHLELSKVDAPGGESEIERLRRNPPQPVKEMTEEEKAKADVAKTRVAGSSAPSAVDPNTVAKKYGLTYRGEVSPGTGVHDFKAPDGGSFALKTDQLGDDKLIKEKLEKRKKEIRPEDLHPVARAKGEDKLAGKVSFKTPAGEFNVEKGTTLYHTTSEEDLHKFDPDRITWFTPDKEQARGYRENTGGKTLTAEFQGGKIATEKDWAPIAKEIFKTDEPIYSMFDENVNEFNKKDVRRFIQKLKDEGYDGAKITDYSSLHSDKDAETIALFNPAKSAKIKSQDKLTGKEPLKPSE